MTMNEAMECRHTVRRYTDRKLSAELAGQLTARIQEHNARYGLGMKLVLENTEAFGPLLRRVLAKGVRNYVVLAGADAPGTDVRLGYCGADVMLFAQTLGLHSWWVGGTFRRRGVRKQVSGPHTETLLGLLALGYGAEQGTPHKSKRPEEISRYEGTPPAWFQEGVRAVLLAPTALNRQGFSVLGRGREVAMSCRNGAFSGVDLGIGMYHFALGAGKESFDWAGENAAVL